MLKRKLVSPMKLAALGCAITLLGYGLASGATEVKTRAISDMFYKDTLSRPVAPKKPVAKPKEPGKTQNIVRTNTEVQPSRRRVGLKYRVQIQSAPDSQNAVDVDPKRTFRVGESIRLLVESNIDGYLYILQKGSSGRESLLFPSPKINGGSNLVKANEVLTVPYNGFFQFDGVAGQEKMLLVVSRSPMDRLPPPADSQPVSEPAPSPVSFTLLMAELGKTIRSRDLVFVKEETPASGESNQPAQHAFVWVNANATDNNQAVYATVELNHQ